MRLTLVGIFLLLSFPLIAQEEVVEAVLSFSDNHFDFGRIYENKGKATHTFSFTNEGNAPLLITNVRSTCGCTLPSWTKEPVLPGGKGEITVEFDPKNRLGNFHKTIQVQSSAINANMFLSISGKVLREPEKEVLNYKIGDLSVKSKHLNLGFIYKGDTANLLMTIANTTTEEMKIEFDHVPDYMVLSANPSVLQAGEYGYIEVNYLSGKVEDWDVVIDRVPIIINGKKIDHNRLPVTANIREDFSGLNEDELLFAPVATFAKPTINFGSISDTAIIACEFILINNGRSELIIRDINPSCGCTAAVPEKGILQPGESTHIEATFDPTGRQGKIKNSLTVITNDPRSYKQFLYMQGVVKK